MESLLLKWQKNINSFIYNGFNGEKSMVDALLAATRIGKNECPICGYKDGTTGELILVQDAKHGEILICSKHLQRGKKKLV